MKSKVFVTGIDTEVGKTVVSAILVKALDADYWKPVQSGDLDYSDTMKVKEWANSPNSNFFQEAYRLNTPASPHLSARIDGVELSLDEINSPSTENNLVIEGAGGLMVPLNDRGDFILDIIEKEQPKIVLVSNNYLGSINHTLSSFEVLKSRGLKVDLLVFSGEENESSQEAIVSHVKPGSVLKIPFLSEVNSETIEVFVSSHKEQITNVFN